MPDEAGRKRAAVELLARHGEALRRTARRYSLCAEDAEDAYQRGLEILLTKAPTEGPRELLAWTTTVIKHEALAVRRGRERLLGRGPKGFRDEDEDWVARVPSQGAGPSERLLRREEVARSREAILALKPAERRALALLGEGYSYAEIGEITGYSATKVNRCLAEGRERFRRLVASSEDGSRCAELRPLLSAFCDGEAGSQDGARVREHLRACAGCRAAMRAYRAAPATVAALCPLPLALAAEAGAEGGAAAGATEGGGLMSLGKAVGLTKLTALNKALTLCAVSGTAACVATGIVPVPSGPPAREVEPRVERIGPRALEPPRAATSVHRRARKSEKAARPKRRIHRREVAAPSPEPIEAAAPPAEPVVPAPEPVEEVPVEAVEAPVSQAPVDTGGAAGEFGP
jgi:RNA polymerase sigma factor (sigma-70 family)